MPASCKHPNEDAARPSTSDGFAKRLRSSTDVRLADSDHALLKFPDRKKGEKAAGACFFKNCSGNWRKCDLPENQLVLARGRLRALEPGMAGQA